MTVIDDEPLTAAEAMAIVAAILQAAREPEPELVPVARSCGCWHVWEFEPSHCGACGYDLRDE